MGEKDHTTDDTTEPIDRGRRRLLAATGGVIAAATGAGILGSSAGQSFRDVDADGIPDSLERSAAFHRRLETVFKEDVVELDPSRKDLLVDVRYIGGTSVSDEAKAYLQALFRENGISLQWLDHPSAYDLDSVRERYGLSIESLLVFPTGFYWNQVESFLRNVAFQLVVVPGRETDFERRQLYSRFYDDHVNGMNIGNRAAIVQRDDPASEAELALHEIAHLALCHDEDPDNHGPMGRETELDLTDREWETLRNNLSNIHDTTGLDVASRQCLVEDYLDGTAA
ncbi:hypothetical protein [Natronococcus sp.]|uniref:hypothetical protein n=1 Tax=Natronococcus sp. TaxID=35747 RepID=UPI003A4D3687